MSEGVLILVLLGLLVFMAVLGAAIVLFGSGPER